jgi:hypothetical protein
VDDPNKQFLNKISELAPSGANAVMSDVVWAVVAANVLLRTLTPNELLKRIPNGCTKVVPPSMTAFSIVMSVAWFSSKPHVTLPNAVNPEMLTAWVDVIKTPRVLFLQAVKFESENPFTDEFAIDIPTAVLECATKLLKLSVVAAAGLIVHPVDPPVNTQFDTLPPWSVNRQSAFKNQEFESVTVFTVLAAISTPVPGMLYIVKSSKTMFVLVAWLHNSPNELA